MFGIFGGLFDFNGNGKLDGMEKIAEIATFASIIDNAMSEDDKTELELAGLDMDDLEFMDPHERREALEDAGIDPDEYEF